MTFTLSYGALPATTAALHGIVVLDFSHVIAGPFATYYLAALGARVIKVENPHRGDSLRSKPRAFESLNHGKEVVQIDLATESGQAKAWSLFESADIVVDNMRPGVLDSFGFGATELRKKKPSLIHCCVSGYGRRSQWAARPTFDHVVQAASGMTMLAGTASDGPIKVGFPVVDSASGMLAALGILAAIRRRDLTGQGESIDVSMMGAAMQLMYSMTVETLATGEAPPRVGNVGYSGSPGAETFQCRDGLLALGANTPQQMMALAGVLNITEAVQALLKGQVKGFVPTENGLQLRALLVEALSKRSALELEQSLNAANVPAAWVRDLGQAVRDADQHQLLEPWTLNGETPIRVPGLGFQAETLFAGSNAPYGQTARPTVAGKEER
jgi:crotonobetainyl-CoA:carnitine CoA-transferase CaiB-like acyl-CoA transferase